MQPSIDWLKPPAGLVDPSTNCFTVIGYGSLVSKDSALTTMPQLRNFRTGRVRGYCRVFNLVSIINIVRGFATGEHLATCTAVRDGKAGEMKVCLFDVPAEEWEGFAKREARLRHEVVEYEEDGARGASDGEQASPDRAWKRGVGVLCTAFSDEEYRGQRCSSDEDYHAQVGQHYAGRLYRRDLLPVPRYLDLVLKAHATLGASFVDDFVGTSFLGDGTPLREYLLQAGLVLPSRGGE